MRGHTKMRRPCKRGAFFHAMLERGVYLPPSAYEAAFITTAHSKPILKKALAAVEKTFKKLPLS